MNRFRCSREDLPAHLYRVQYDGCNTEYTAQGLFAADTSLALEKLTLPEIRMLIINQFTRDNRVPTPFISTFSECEHAENWALKMGQNVTLLRISTALMDNPDVFKLSTLVRMLRVTIPEAAMQHVDGAYLCGYNISHNAIIDVMDRAGIEMTVDGRGEDSGYDLPYDPNDSDDEAIMNNCNDDIMKVVEGDWD